MMLIPVNDFQFTTIPTDGHFVRMRDGKLVNQTLEYNHLLREARLRDLLDSTFGATLSRDQVVMAHDFYYSINTSDVYMGHLDFKTFVDKLKNVNKAALSKLEKKVESYTEKVAASQEWQEKFPAEYDTLKIEAIRKYNERKEKTKSSGMTSQDRTNVLAEAREKRKGDNKHMPSLLIASVTTDDQGNTNYEIVSTAERSLANAKEELESFKNLMDEMGKRVTITEDFSGEAPSVSVHFTEDNVTLCIRSVTASNIKRLAKNSTDTTYGFKWTGPLAFVSQISSKTVDSKKDADGNTVYDTSRAVGQLNDLVFTHEFMSFVPLSDAKAVHDKIVDICKRIYAQISPESEPEPEVKAKPDESETETASRRVRPDGMTCVRGVVDANKVYLLEDLVEKKKRFSEHEKIHNPKKRLPKTKPEPKPETNEAQE